MHQTLARMALDVAYCQQKEAFGCPSPSCTSWGIMKTNFNITGEYIVWNLQIEVRVNVSCRYCTYVSGQVRLGGGGDILSDCVGSWRDVHDDSTPHMLSQGI